MSPPTPNSESTTALTRRSLIVRAGGLGVVVAARHPVFAWGAPTRSYEQRTLLALAETVHASPVNRTAPPPAMAAAIDRRRTGNSFFDQAARNVIRQLDELADARFADLAVPDRLAVLRDAEFAGEGKAEPTVSSPDELPDYLARLSAEIRANMAMQGSASGAGSDGFSRPSSADDMSASPAMRRASAADRERQQVALAAMDIVQIAAPESDNAYQFYGL